MAPRRLPSFCKILLDRSAPHLRLPLAFVQKHLENKIPDNSILQSVNGGYSWNLKVQKLGEDYCFVNGWNQVVEDSQLGFADFLVFWLVDPSTFKLSIFSPSGCEKILPVKNDYVNMEEEEDGEEEHKEEDEEGDRIYEDGGSRCGGNADVDESDPFFKTIMSQGHTSSLRLPVKFARLAGFNRERLITMKSLEGKEWKMGLKMESHHYIRYYLSAGWSKFLRANKLSEGDECVFKYIRSQDKLCLTKVTKKRLQTAGKAPAGVVLKRQRRESGRPFKRKRGPMAAHVK